MKKAVKYLLGFVSGVIIFIIFTPLLVALLLQINFVQQWAVDTATEFLTKKAGTKFSISKIELDLFKNAYFENVYIEDFGGDTLIHIKRLNVGVQSINFFNGKISLNTVTADSAKVYLYRDSLGVVNVKRVFDNFKPEIPPHDPPNFRLSAMQVNLLNSHFKLFDVSRVVQSNGLNFKDLNISNIYFQAQDVNVLNYDVRFGINFFRFKEKCGLVVDNIYVPSVVVNSTGLRFDKLELDTPHSSLDTKHFNLLYPSWYAFSDFEHGITFDVDILPSTLNFKTINYFLKENVPIGSLPFKFEGSVVGTIPRLVGKVEQLHVDNTNLTGNFVITGLPEVENTTFEFDLNQLKTDVNSIDKIVERFSKVHISNDLHKMLTACGDIYVHGRFDGLLKNFKTNCTATTSLGTILAGLQVEPYTDAGIKFAGAISTANFNLGDLLSVKNIDKASVTAQVHGGMRLNSVRFNANAKVNHLQWNGYSFHGIELNGAFNNRIFSGRLVSDADSNFLFSTDGVFDFTDSELPKYNFEMDLQKIDLRALKINQRDSVSLLSADFKAHFEGTNIDNINGNINIDSIYYVNQLDTVHTSAIDIYSVNTEDQKEITVFSDFMDARLQGKNSFSNIFNYFGQMASTYIPAFDDATEIVTGKKTASSKIVEQTYKDGYYTLDVDVKKANNVASILMPGLEIAEGTALNFFFNPSKQKFSVALNSAYIAKNDKAGRGVFLIENLLLDSRNVVDSLSVFVTADAVTVSDFVMPDFSIIGGVRNNHVSFSTRFTDSKNGNTALLNTLTRVFRNANGVAQIEVNLFPSNVKLNNKTWLLSDCKVLIDTTGIAIDRFELRNSPQSLVVSGKLGRDVTDSLNVDINRFNIDPASFILSDLGYSLKGSATGNITGVSMLSKPQFFAAVDFNDVLFADYSLPDSRLTSTLDQESNRIKIELEANQHQPVFGYYDLQTRRFNVNFDFPALDMVLLEPLLQGILTKTKGVANAQLVLSGTGDTPTLNGKIKVNNYSATVDFTKVKYTFSGDIEVKDNRFELAPTSVFDIEGHSGEISAFFDSEYFTSLTFGINARFNDLMAINTTAKDNSLFYGKGYGSGVLNIVGNEQKTSLNITAQTALNSSIVMPFSNVSTVSQSNFITFIDPNKPVEDRLETLRQGFLSKRLRDKVSNELDMHLDIQVLPNTTALIQYSNSIMNNIIRGQGRGRLRMRINPSQEIFTLDGPLEIEKGSYRLVLEIADKTFSLQPGGRINWSGDPANPTVDFMGVYKVRTSLEPLTGSIGGGSSTANINCGITLNGNLWNPTIGFSITAPSATPETQNILRNSLNTEETLSMQFLSLFISNTFMPNSSASSIGTMSGAFVATTGFEFLSSQIGTLFSTQNFNFRPTYRPRSETAAEEFGFKASLNLLQDKVLIEAEGNYTTGQTDGRQTTPFTGGGNVTWVLNKTGTLSVKGFTRVIDRFDETQGLQESGVGVYFRQDFQNWRDLQNRYRNYLNRIKENRESKKELRFKRHEVKDSLRGVEK